MVRSESMGENALAVPKRGIAGVVNPVVERILFVEFVHSVVAVGFGKDGGGCDGKKFAVAFDDGLMRQVLVGLEAISVHDEELRSHAEGVESAVHREDGGVQDVDAVNFLGRHAGNRPSERIALNDGAEFSTATVGQLLGIVEFVVFIVGREYHGGGKDFACQTSAPGFVKSGFKEMGRII